MCGIAGILSHSGALVDQQLTRMQEAIAHRGPDDRGAWRSPAGHASYVHTRLSIIDPTPAGHQPMATSDGRLTITYNGEIYNHAELRQSLQRAGVSFGSTSDTEVLLRLYESEGPRFVERLRGMFAFAIWDDRERSCFLARDRFGIKPLYYRETGDALAFASEVRAIVAAGASTALDAQAAYEYFRFGSVPEPLTLYRGVRALEAGHYMIWRPEQVSIRPYWDVHFCRQSPVADAARVTRDALNDAVAHHFVSDVPVGIFLSGGVDSSALLAVASAMQGDRLRTFSIALPGSPLDEGPEARRTAQLFKTDHHEWAIDARSARPLFDEFLAAADQPSIDGFNTYTVSRLARDQGTKVVLSGLGGDEMFGGYPSFREVPRLATLGRWGALAGPAGAGAVKLAATMCGSRLRRLTDLVAGRPDLDVAYQVFRGIYTRDEARALTEHYVGGAAATVDHVDPCAASSGDDARDVVSRLELTRYLRNQLLRDSDVMGMACGVELRVPFLDHKLFEAMARIPACQRLRPDKQLLVQAVPEIPSWVTSRPKRGFIFPMQHWFENEWAGELTRFNGSAAERIAPLDTWYRKWSVLAFERWLERRTDHNV